MGSAPLGCAIPTPPSGLNAPRPLDRPLHRRWAPLLARGPGFLPTPTPAGTHAVGSKGNVTASLALDGPVAPSAPLSQFRRHVVDQRPPLVTTLFASLHRSIAKAFTPIQPSPHGHSPPSPHATFYSNLAGLCFGTSPLARETLPFPGDCQWT